MGTKGRVRDDSGLDMKSKRSNEFDLKEQMGAKVSVGEDQRRNGIGYSKPGDKLYSTPEYSVGFYKSGNLIPSSYFGDRKKKAESSKEESKSQGGDSRPKSIPYTEKFKHRKETEERSSVTELLSWEARTGYYTRAPKSIPQVTNDFDSEMDLSLGKVEKGEEKESKKK